MSTPACPNTPPGSTAGVEAALPAAIVGSTREAIVGYGLDGTIVVWNSGAKRLYGYSAGEAVGQGASFTLPPDRTDEITLALERVGRDEPCRHFETVRLTRNGTALEVDVTFVPIRDRRGQAVGLATLARDLTEHRWMAATLDQTIAKLEAAVGEAQESEARSRRLLADVAHRLRNLTTGLQAGAEVALRTQTRRRREVLLEEMLAETAVVSRYVRLLLRMARLDAGMALERRPCDVVALCRAQVDVAATLAPGLDITHRTSGTPCLAFVDAQAVEEIVENLLNNAARHAATRIEVSTEAAGDTLEIRVLDDGAGMSEETAARAFERFVSLDHKGGSGLGLSIARELAAAHGGELSYQGPTGGFLLQLPTSLEPPSPDATGMTAPANPETS